MDYDKEVKLVDQREKVAAISRLYKESIKLLNSD